MLVHKTLQNGDGGCKAATDCAITSEGKVDLVLCHEDVWGWRQVVASRPVLPHPRYAERRLAGWVGPTASPNVQSNNATLPRRDRN